MAIIEDENLEMYVEESLEHLETIEADLLEIEKAGEVIDEDLVNKVFRAAHSVKGGAGFFGLDNVKELSHKTENVLDMVRNLELIPTSDLINIVLKAFDRLGEMLEDIMNSNEMDIDVHVTDLVAIATGTMSDAEKQNCQEKSDLDIADNDIKFQVSQFDLDQARKGGKNLYLIEFDLVQDSEGKGRLPQDLVNTLGDAGILLDSKFYMSLAGDLDEDDFEPTLPWDVLYASVLEPDLLSSMLNLDSSKITLLPKGKEGLNENIKIDQSLSPREESEPETNEKKSPLQEKDKHEPKQASPAKKPKAKPSTTTKTNLKAESLRVSIKVLDTLMNRAGEMVLARNELLLAISGSDHEAITIASQRINLVTQEMQESIMATRMQPVGIIFNKFNRVVYDMARLLGKKMALQITGSEIELDKSIIEGLGDPLTHLIRNSCDHGIEMPDVRAEKGKPKEGTISLKAFHESGQVLIEIVDDGKGLDSEKLANNALAKGIISKEQAKEMTDQEKIGLIMLPGFSTQNQVSDISGRGVGMDVVKTNLDQLGGHVELISIAGKGTTIRIKLPLTLAIMPSLLIEGAGERFAIPQVNIRELLRIPASYIRDQIDKVGGSDVLILRGELIPLLQLNNVMDLAQTYYDQKLGVFRPDRREGLSDERLNPDSLEEADQATVEESDEPDERRNRYASDVSIVILQAGSFRFGLVVEKVHDTIEIVVKPLGRHFKKCGIYAGATLLGDGRVALILDIAGLGKSSELSTLESKTKISDLSDHQKKEDEKEKALQSLLIFYNAPDESFAVPLHLILRIEKINTDQIKIKGGKKVIQYREGSLPVFALEEVASVGMLEERSQLNVIIFLVAGREIGLLAVPPLDIVEDVISLDEVTLKQPGISGSIIIRDETTLMVDIFDFIKTLSPEWFEQREFVSPENREKDETTSRDLPILLAEDSTFFRVQVKQFIESEGYSVLDFEDGELAWDYLDANPDNISMVVTDLEMPNMDGFELTRKIKEDKRLSHLKVLALTSLAEEKHLEKGKEVGIDNYQIKLDKEKLLQGIYDYLH